MVTSFDQFYLTRPIFENSINIYQHNQLGGGVKKIINHAREGAKLEKVLITGGGGISTPKFHCTIFE